MKLTAGLADVIRRPTGDVVILLYHRVGAGSSSTVDLPASRFEEQMAALASSHRVVTIAEALRVLAGHGPGPCVAVTFDDGTADLVEVALPILVRHAIPSTWYVATGFVDAQRPFGSDGTPLSWGALREACATGLVSVGSHTHTHRLLDRATEAEVHDELSRSIGLIGEHLGDAPLDFAYPKALAGSPVAEEAVRTHFRSAALAGTRANVIGATDPHRLARSPIQVADGRVWFERKLAGGMGFEDVLRGLVNRRRYASSST